jgi:hypothetical protein
VLTKDRFAPAYSRIIKRPSLLCSGDRSITIMRSDEDNKGCRFELQVHRHVLLWLGLSYVLIFAFAFLFRFTAQMERVVVLRGEPNVISSIEVTILATNEPFKPELLPQTDASPPRPPNIEEADDVALNQSVSKQRASDKPKVLCWYDKPYGRAMNQYLQLATLLHQATLLNGTHRTVVALRHSAYNNFFRDWFDPRDDVLLDYRGRCDQSYNASTLFYMYYPNGWQDVAAQFQTLIPKASIRAEAAAALQEYRGPQQRPVTTVHRRDLERGCNSKALQRHGITCPSVSAAQEMPVSDLVNACQLDYPMIKNETNGTQVVLFTDGQVPKLDRTFPIRSNHSFPVQAWMMATSAVHYGNPFSSCDTVVYFWRMGLSTARGTMRPEACYQPMALS